MQAVSTLSSTVFGGVLASLTTLLEVPVLSCSFSFDLCWFGDSGLPKWLVMIRTRPSRIVSHSEVSLYSV